MESLDLRECVFSQLCNVRSVLAPSDDADYSTDHIGPNVMIPQRRLETLLEQAKSMQRINCIYHASDTPISLLADCACDPAAFPSVTTHILTEHTDEIWRLEFSHDGEWLATAGRDKTAIIWNVKVSRAILLWRRRLNFDCRRDSLWTKFCGIMSMLFRRSLGRLTIRSCSRRLSR